MMMMRRTIEEQQKSRPPGALGRDESFREKISKCVVRSCQSGLRKILQIKYDASGIREKWQRSLKYDKT